MKIYNSLVKAYENEFKNMILDYKYIRITNLHLLNNVIFNKTEICGKLDNNIIKKIDDYTYKNTINVSPLKYLKIDK